MSSVTMRDDNPIVPTEYGPVKGLRIQSELGFDYFGFRGIPYMKQPLGKLRFMEAQAPEKWTEIFDATGDIPCYCGTSFMTGEQEGQENAAVVNVFVKNSSNSKKRLPVMIWIHGGAFSRGSSRDDLYNPDFLFMTNDIIFVSFNYRLGAIGFLSLSDPKLNVPGNNGLKDQVFALQWVKRNIENFGGDSDNITIFGESAGGASVHYMCLTPRTRGLFHRAIVISGCALNKTWTVPDKKAEALARELGWNGEKGDEKNILEFLEGVSPFDLDTAIYKIVTLEEKLKLGSIMAFGPVVEPYMTDNCVVYKDTVEMAREAWTNEIDIIVMGNSFEGLLFADLDKGRAAEYRRTHPQFYAPLNELKLQPDSEKAIRAGKMIEKLYNNDKEQPEDFVGRYYKYCSDFHFWYGLYRAVASRRVNSEKAKTFLIRFDVDGELNLFKKFVKKCTQYAGACHADDLFYIFLTKFYPMPSVDSREFTTVKKLCSMLTSFAVCGDPNSREIDNLKLKPVENVESLKCVNITLDKFEEIELPELEKFKVWNLVYRECAMDPIRSKI